VASKKNKDPSEVVDEAIDMSKVASSEETEKVTEAEIEIETETETETEIEIETETETVEVAAKGELDFSLQVAKLQEALVEAKDESLRNQAEMQNILRRSERDIQSAHKYALDKFVAELLPVVDNLERALQSIDQDKEDFKLLAEGVGLTLKGFQDVLMHHKVLSIDPKGEIFDPDLHQAMSILEQPEAAPNTVIDVFQKGYTLNGRLVRPAMVVVAKA